MLRRTLAKATLTACLAVVVLPAAASAQSAITGLVKDSSGAVLPGVTDRTEQQPELRPCAGAACRPQHQASVRHRVQSRHRPATGGGNAFGGWSADKLVTVACASSDPNTFRNCDQSQPGMPFRHDFKFAGSYPIVWGVQVGAMLQSYAGAPLAVNWSVPANLFPGGRTQSVTVNLVTPGSKYLERWNQLDLSFRKTFSIGKYRVDGALDMFNALNSNVVLSENQNFGSTLGQPQAVLQGRLLRLSSQIKF